MRRAVLLAAVLVVASTAVYGRPAYAVGNPGGGATLDCTPASPQLIVSHGNLTRVAGGGTLNCVPPGAPQGTSFGRTDYPAPTPPTPGTTCHVDAQSPMQFRMNGATYEGNIHDPQGNPPPTWGGPGFQNLAVLPSQNDGLGRVEDLYKVAGTSEVMTPWAFDGIWDAQARCVSQVPASPANPSPGWTSPCRIGGNATWPACLTFVPVAIAGGAAPPAGVCGWQGIACLTDLVRGAYTSGDISSLPSAPQHPGLTNLATCFYVSDMRVDNAPATPLQPIAWERVSVDPNPIPGTNGRHIVYSFLVTVSYQGTTWDFGDNTQEAVAPGGQSRDMAGATECARNTVPNQQFAAAHVYHRYSPAGSFPVRVMHHYGIRVDEAWIDSAGNHRINDVPTGIGPIDVPGAPNPFLMPVIQEEGVPVT